jgi:hypothetical protein
MQRRAVSQVACNLARARLVVSFGLRDDGVRPVEAEGAAVICVAALYGFVKIRIDDEFLEPGVGRRGGGRCLVTRGEK